MRPEMGIEFFMSYVMERVTRYDSRPKERPEISPENGCFFSIGLIKLFGQNATTQ